MHNIYYDSLGLRSTCIVYTPSTASVVTSPVVPT